MHSHNIFYRFSSKKNIFFSVSLAPSKGQEFQSAAAAGKSSYEYIPERRQKKKTAMFTYQYRKGKVVE